MKPFSGSALSTDSIMQRHLVVTDGVLVAFVNNFYKFKPPCSATNRTGRQPQHRVRGTEMKNAIKLYHTLVNFAIEFTRDFCTLKI